MVYIKPFGTETPRMESVVTGAYSIQPLPLPHPLLPPGRLGGCMKPIRWSRTIQLVSSSSSDSASTLVFRDVPTHIMGTLY